MQVIVTEGRGLNVSITRSNLSCAEPRIRSKTFLDVA